MFIVEVSGAQIRRARELLGLSPGQLAQHSGVNRITLRLYESYGDEAPSAQTHVLARLLNYLQGVGIEFRSDNTVHLNRGMPLSRAAVHPEAAA
jgi:predicted transcriptional regulator